MTWVHVWNFLIYLGAVGAGVGFLWGMVKGTGKAIAAVVETFLGRYLTHALESSQVLKDLATRVEEIEEKLGCSRS